MNRVGYECQACGKEVIVAEFSGEQMGSKEYVTLVRSLHRKEVARRLTCGCGKPVPVCTKCGACCAFQWAAIWAGVRRRGKVTIRPGHLEEFDGVEGALKWTKRAWTRGHRVCVFAKPGVGCRLHGSTMQPVVCMRFNCEAVGIKGEEDFAQFFEFKRRWLAEGMDRVFRGETK